MSVNTVFTPPGYNKHVLPQDDTRRKAAPMCRAALDYFPAAIFAVAEHSYRGDRKHNPDKPEGSDPTWARDKATDHFDCILRHLAERGSDPAYHLRAVAWRALAALQEYCETHEGAAPGLASVFPNGPENGCCEGAAGPTDGKAPVTLPAIGFDATRGISDSEAYRDLQAAVRRATWLHDVLCPARLTYAPCTCRGRR